MKNVNIIIGLGFGDEGKGRVTDHFTSLADDPLVIRFNGGNQAAHSVKRDGKLHIFSSFGSGTLLGAPTYISNFCTVDPAALNLEHRTLTEHAPLIYVDGLCPITTRFEVMENRNSKEINVHGTCGAGFGLTKKRHEETPYRLFVNDLLNENIWKDKLIEIGMSLYTYPAHIVARVIEEYKSVITEFLDTVVIVNENSFFRQMDHCDLIFEGAQGVLLDREHGFFPNVTRSHTTSKNAMTIIQRNNLRYDSLQVDWVTRCYHTRHGNGRFVDGEGTLELNVKFKESETNETNPYQGIFRTAPLDLKLLQHAQRIDRMYSNMTSKHLIHMTCMDQLKEYPLNVGGTLVYLSDPSEFYQVFKEEIFFYHDMENVPVMKMMT